MSGRPGAGTAYPPGQASAPEAQRDHFTRPAGRDDRDHRPWAPCAAAQTAPLTGPDPHDWFVDIAERGMIGDNRARCADSDLFDHPQDHDMELLHHNYALYHEDMPRSSARHARPENLAVFEEGLDCLQDAKSRQPAPPLAAKRERGLGNLWNEAHE